MSTTRIPEATRERVLRGLILHADHEITHDGHGVYSVPGCSGGSYTVDLDVFADDPRETCNCPDHARTRATCKHIVAATIHRARSRAALRRSARPRFDAATVKKNLARMGA